MKEFQFKREPPRTALSDKRHKMLQLRAVWPLQVGFPRPKRQGPRRLTPSAKLECLLCKGDHFVRNCQSLPTAQQATERSRQARETEPQKQVTVPSARPSVPNEPIAMFKLDGIAVLSEYSPDDQLIQADSPPSSGPTPQSESPVQEFDPALKRLGLNPP